MKKIGYDTKPEHQMCYNHAIQLCVIDVLFKKNNTLPNNNFVNEDGDIIEAVNHDDGDDHEEEDENPIEYV